MTQIEELKKKRFQFLHKLYELSQGNEDKHFMLSDIGEQLGFEEQLTENIGQFLRGENLIVFKDFDQDNGIVNITHYGIKEIEDAISNPNVNTKYFPPVINIISVEKMINSQIQQGSPGASQFVVIGEEKYEEIKQLLKMLKESDQSELSPQQKSELDAEVKTIDAQMSSSKPKNTIITECLISLRNILEGATGSVLATVFLNKISALLGG
jgi:hypothetical protein